MLAEKESAAPAQGIIPLCNLKTRKTGTGFYACPLFSILKMLLSLRRQRGTASRKHNPYQYRIFSQGNSVCAYIAFETHIRCKTDNFALFAPPNKKSNLHCPPTKRELAGYDAGIHATDNESLKADLQAAFNRKSVLLKKQEAALKDFTKQTGLIRDRSREQVSAHFDSKQGKTVAFNKSVSQKAVSVVQRNQKFIENMEAIGIHTEGFDRFAGKTEVLNEMQSAYSKIAEIYPEELKGLTIRYAFDKDASVYGWYDNTINEIAFNRNIFDHYDKLVKEYAECVQSGHFSPNTDYRSCFYHEFGHLYSNFHNIDNKSIVEELTKEYWGGHYTKKKADEMLYRRLSEYATEETRPKYQEVIAECFSEWYNSKNPRKFCEDYLRKVGAIQ